MSKTLSLKEKRAALREALRDPKPWSALFGMLVLMVIGLRSQGRLWIAASGQIRLWVSDTFSSENSQHISDPYSFSHMQHGLVFFFVLLWAMPRASLAWRFVASATMEAAWEMLENSAFIIDRYRSGTAAVGYVGDTILNSVSDVACCTTGFLIAYLLGAKRTVALFVVVEVAMVIAIRDSLLINVIMLIHPIPALRAWQAS